MDGPASTAHCFYCFEVLSSHFENREPPSLSKVIQLWQEYEAHTKPPPSRPADVASPLSVRNVTPSGQLSPGAGALAVPVDRTQDVSPAESSLSGGKTTDSSKAPSAESSSTSLSSSASEAPHDLLAGISAKFPVYVTWNTLSRHGKSLRGCIGTFEALPLEEGLRTYSLVSALEDYRFSPIPASLVGQLGCELTLLADFEPCAHALDWDVGTHGLRISFVWKGKRYSATYLPHVCPEQGWTKEECVVSLMHKAGWEPEKRGSGMTKRWLSGGSRGGGDSSGDRPDGEDGEGRQKKAWEMVADMKVVRYTGFHAAASYRDWKSWRQWASRRI